MQFYSGVDTIREMPCALSIHTAGPLSGQVEFVDENGGGLGGGGAAMEPAAMT